MKNSKTPIIELIKLFKEKIVFISIVFLLCIASSFYYNKNFKTIEYKYELKFDVLSSWDASQLKLQYKDVIGLTRGSILGLIKEFKPLDYNLNFNNNFSLYFEVLNEVNIENFIEDLSMQITNNIEEILNQKLELLELEYEREQQSLFRNIQILETERENLNLKIEEIRINIEKEHKNKIINQKEILVNRLSSLVLEKELMESQFGNFLQDKMTSLNFNDNNSSKFAMIISLKKDYYEVSKQIIYVETIIKKLDMEMKKKLDIETILYQYLDRMFDSFETFSKIERTEYRNESKFKEAYIALLPKIDNLSNKILTQQTSLKFSTKPSKILEVENTIKNFKASKNKAFYNISNWNISSNKFKNSEIIVAGILFGILLNAFLLFIGSDYFRKNLFK